MGRTGRPAGRSRRDWRADMNGGKWWGDWTERDGRRVRRPLDERQDVAWALLQEHTAHMRGGVAFSVAAPRLTKSAPVEAILAAYEERLNQSARPETVRAFEVARKPLQRILGPKARARDLKLRDLERYLATRMKEVSARTASREMAALRAALRWAAANEYVDRLPPKFPSPKIPRKLRRRITPAEAELLFSKAPDQRTRVLLKLCWFALLRKSEALFLRWADLTLEGEAPELRVTAKPEVNYKPKTHAERRVPLAPPLLAELRAWRDVCPPSKGAWLLPSVPGCKGQGGRWANPMKQVEDTFLAAGLQGFGLHALRSGAATDLLVRRKVASVTVRDLGGWSNTQTLEQFYADSNADSMRDAVDTLGGGAESKK